MDYLLKSALISATLYAFYKVFLERETFFQSNRVYFIIGVFIALLLPLVLIPIEVIVQSPNNLPNNDVTPLLNEFENTAFVETIYANKSFDWSKLLFSIYWVGVGVLALKFVLEILALFYLIYKNPRKREDDYIQVETKSKTAPFSFFIWIVFNKNQYTKSELKYIINHERVHVKQWHSVDMLFIQLLTIIQWFNPFVWLFRKVLQQNLEYIADKNVHLAFKGTTEKESNLKDYQYLLLKTGIGKDPFATTNNFFNSHLKKRIIMLQKSKKTNRFNQFKYVLLLPLLALFIYSFSTKEVFIPIESPHIETVFIENEQEVATPIHFIMPIHENKLTRMSSGYGMRTHPISKIRKMHLGMDFAAPKGTDLVASASGIVLKATENANYGKMLQIKHANGYQTNYYHLQNYIVKTGDRVQVGNVIGKVGSTGESVAPHFHFEIVKDGKHINPISVLSVYR